jgi:hypothetical protein
LQKPPSEEHPVPLYIDSALHLITSEPFTNILAVALPPAALPKPPQETVRLVIIRPVVLVAAEIRSALVDVLALALAIFVPMTGVVGATPCFKLMF